MQYHKNVALSYSHTSHSLTSQLPSKDPILGYFEDGSNCLMIQTSTSTEEDPRLFFKCDIQNGDFYQTAIAEKGTQKLTRSERIDIVMGFERRGRTYLYSAVNELYEVPVSYWSDGTNGSTVRVTRTGQQTSLAMWPRVVLSAARPISGSFAGPTDHSIR
jgi:hypothetical protein